MKIYFAENFVVSIREDQIQMLIRPMPNPALKLQNPVSPKTPAIQAGATNPQPSLQLTVSPPVTSPPVVPVAETIENFVNPSNLIFAPIPLPKQKDVEAAKALNDKISKIIGGKNGEVQNVTSGSGKLNFEIRYPNGDIATVTISTDGQPLGKTDKTSRKDDVIEIESDVPYFGEVGVSKKDGKEGAYYLDKDNNLINAILISGK